MTKYKCPKCETIYNLPAILELSGGIISCADCNIKCLKEADL